MFHHNDSIIVKNITGTSKPRYVVARLREKFEEFAGYEHKKCQVKGCPSDAAVTAHVRKVDGRRDDNWYLTRMCATHNNYTNTEPMALRKNAALVPLAEVRAA